MVDAITAELARSDRTGVPPSILMLDLDNFRRINTVYGHAVGDRVLSVVARRLQGRLRGYDVLGRWGGEEFIVLAPGVPDDATLLRLAEQIRRLVGQLPVAIDEETLLPVTVSVGAVRAGDALRSVEGLVDCANRALAAAKRLGRDRVQLFGDLTVEDLVAEEPEPIRLARALALLRQCAPRPAAGRRGARLGAGGRDRGADAASTRPRPSAAVSEDCYMTLAQHRCRQHPRPGGTADRARPAHLRGPRGGGRAPGADRRRHLRRGRRSWARTRNASTAPGYPSGLSGTEIPLESRIVACAVAYERLAQVLGRDEAARALERQSGNALDAHVVASALAVLARDGNGTAQLLRDVPTA